MSSTSPHESPACIARGVGKGTRRNDEIAGGGFLARGQRVSRENMNLSDYDDDAADCIDRVDTTYQHGWRSRRRQCYTRWSPRAPSWARVRRARRKSSSCVRCAKKLIISHRSSRTWRVRSRVNMSPEENRLVRVTSQASLHDASLHEDDDCGTVKASICDTPSG